MKEACVARALPARTCHCYPQLLSSFLYYFSLLYLDRPSTGAEVARYEHFVFFLLVLVSREFCFCLWGQYSFGVFETYRFLLENLKVVFRFSTNTVT